MAHFLESAVRYGADAEPITDAYVLFSNTNQITWSYLTGGALATPHGVVEEGAVARVV